MEQRSAIKTNWRVWYVIFSTPPDGDNECYSEQRRCNIDNVNWRRKELVLPVASHII